MHFNKIKILFLCFLLAAQLYAQTDQYEGPTDESGDPGALRVGLMNGNRVSLRFSNKIALGGWPSPDVSFWPNDDTGLNTLDALNLIVGNIVYLRNDSIAVTDENEIQNDATLKKLWYVQSSSLQGGFMDQNAGGTVDWGFNPVFGYFNELNDYPAMSNLPDSWPLNGWPSRGFEKKWPGEWNGRFGRGIKYADMEAYYVANDAQDLENLQSISKQKFYPRPGVKIGDISPGDITVQLGSPWGGLGIRVEVRTYQWNNLQSRDAIFFEYNISNISEYDLARGVFGFYLDAANGNKAPTSGLEDQIGYFDKLEDLEYTWSKSGTGFGGGKPCVSGWAFLESPGLPNDGIDNDDDGLTDEKRDNIASILVGAYDGITDLQKFLSWYNLSETNLKPHWDADEDQDWSDGIDNNNNGIYEPDEYAGNDVGLDGVGPTDINYYGPDADGSECNHKPDYLEGYGSEPNFAATDISESDMLGLTSFQMFVHPQTNSPQLRFDQAAYNIIASDTLIEFFGTPSNLYSAFGSGTFRFPKGGTERFSISQVNSYDDLGGLNATGHKAPSLYIKKRVVQGIYETDYRFSQPPFTPKLSAKGGDGKVFLSWDNNADKLTREPLLRNVNDFEGYKLYKATDKHFRDAELLYDAYGNAAGKKPIFQCDKIDGIVGIPPHTYFNGLGYYLGDDSGIQHYYIDENVQNGRTYYYAIVAYDYGMEEFGKNGVSIPPAENNTVIDLDENESIRFTGRNVQVVTPFQTALGFDSPEFSFDDPHELRRLAEFAPGIFNVDSIKGNHTYTIKFDTVSIASSINRKDRSKRDNFFVTTGYSVYDQDNNNKKVYHEDFSNAVGENWIKGTIKPVSGNSVDYEYLNPTGVRSEVFDGLQLSFVQRSEPNQLNPFRSGWVTGNAPMEVTIDSLVSQFFAYNYDIVFVDTLYHTRTTKTSPIAVRDLSRNVVSATKVLLKESFPFIVINKSAVDSNGNYEQLDLLVHDVDGNKVYDLDTDYVYVGYSDVTFKGTIFGIRFPGPEYPQPGDVFRLNFTPPLRDSIMIKVDFDPALDKASLANDMSKIKVVPNPYIVTNTMEQAISNQGLNQQRQLMFTHIPAQSTIKIFTSSGVLIKELDIDNRQDNGTYHWNLLTEEGLEIAAGIYVYLVESKVTSDKKIGKFAVIK
ncbi:MAG: hypothetical protein V1720_13040 [bacterium]